MELDLSAIADFIPTHPQYAYAAVFLLALSEAVPIVGTVVPGSTLIIAISALSGRGDVDAALLLVAATAGAIVGDGLSYWLGARFHHQILLRWPLNRFPAFIAYSETFFRKYGTWSVFLARFTAVVRAFVPLIAGIFRMPAKDFYFANIFSALIWAPAHVFPGFFVGAAASIAGVSSGKLLVLVVLGMLLLSAGVWAFRRFVIRGIARQGRVPS
ncbi:MAG TPA: DedA family protein [Xanthobacteraceae bacterium]|jgi:membrane protein DedA with SNARE-associated domain|nr:DedA family protein [Xanthobacteraceae bacterium]